MFITLATPLGRPISDSPSLARSRSWRKLLKKYGFVPDKLVTDDLRSYGAAASDLGIAKRHERGRWRNNRKRAPRQKTAHLAAEARR
jgi:transposase-like protein